MNNHIVEATLTAYYDAFQKQDWNLFQNLLTEDFSYYTDTCVIRNKTDFVSFLSKNEWKVNSYSISDLEFILSHQQDIVIAIYRIKFQGVAQNQEMTLYATETTIFKKIISDYKITHSHTSNK